MRHGDLHLDRGSDEIERIGIHPEVREGSCFGRVGEDPPVHDLGLGGSEGCLAARRHVVVVSGVVIDADAQFAGR